MGQLQYKLNAAPSTFAETNDSKTRSTIQYGPPMDSRMGEVLIQHLFHSLLPLPTCPAIERTNDEWDSIHCQVVIKLLAIPAADKAVLSIMWENILTIGRNINLMYLLPYATYPAVDAPVVMWERMGE